jgi:hypothetical protein
MCGEKTMFLQMAGCASAAMLDERQEQNWIPALLALRARPSGQLRCSLALLAVAGMTATKDGALPRNAMRRALTLR